MQRARLVPYICSSFPSAGQDQDALPRATQVGRQTLVPARLTLRDPVRARVTTRVVYQRPREVPVTAIPIPAVPAPATLTVTTPMGTTLADTAARAPAEARLCPAWPRPSAGSRLFPTLTLKRADSLLVRAGIRPATMPALARLLQLQQTQEPAVQAWLDAAVHDLRQGHGVRDLVPL